MKSLELNWIRKQVDKTIPIPEVMFYPLAGASGKYYSPRNTEMFDLDGKPYHMRYGIIVINPRYSNIATTIAHEWRHHWQHFHGIKFQISPLGVFSKMKFNEGLVSYFKSSRTERDALRFQYKHAGIHDGWEEILQPILQDLIINPTITYGNNTISN